jgi:hypothetical protein
MSLFGSVQLRCSHNKGILLLQISLRKDTVAKHTNIFLKVREGTKLYTWMSKSEPA